MNQIYSLSKGVFILKGLSELPFKEYTDCILAIFTRVSNISPEEIINQAKIFQLYEFEIPNRENIGDLLETKLTAQFKEQKQLPIGGFFDEKTMSMFCILSKSDEEFCELNVKSLIFENDQEKF